MTENTATTENTANTVSAVDTDAAARKFATAWDTSASNIYNAAVQARSLKSAGLKGTDIVDTLRVAIAERQAETLNITDPVDIAGIAQAVKLSTSAVSQLTKAIERAELANTVPSKNKSVVKAFYDAATGKVKAGDLNALVSEAAELTGDMSGIVEYVLKGIATLRSAAGRNVSANKPSRSNADNADSADSTATEVHVSKAGAAAFTLAEILHAAEQVAANENDNGKKMIRAIAQQIVETLAN